MLVEDSEGSVASSSPGAGWLPDPASAAESPAQLFHFVKRNIQVFYFIKKNLEDIAGWCSSTVPFEVVLYSNSMC